MSRGDEQASGIPATGQHAGTGGLTIREHFAAMAMQGVLGNSACDFEYTDLADNSVMCADALIAALEKRDARTD